jgi:hypothetical protein
VHCVVLVGAAGPLVRTGTPRGLGSSASMRRRTVPLVALGDLTFIVVPLVNL